MPHARRGRDDAAALEQQLRAEARAAASEQQRAAVEVAGAREAAQQAQAEAMAMRSRAQAAQREAEDARLVPPCALPYALLWDGGACSHAKQKALDVDLVRQGGRLSVPLQRMLIPRPHRLPTSWRHEILIASLT